MSNYTVKSLEGKLILAATILASAMAFLDGTVVNIAAPTIQDSFGASLSQVEWMINGYTLVLAPLILISGSLGDRYGRKRIFIYGIAAFVLASILCSVAQSINQLIAFRILQGIGASMMIPGSLSIIDMSFASSVRGRAIGLWSGYAAGVTSLGPFMGGWLVQTLGWQSIFLLNIPIGIIAFILALRYIPESRNEKSCYLDIWGAIVIFLSLLGLSYSLMEAPARGWTDPTIVLGLFGGAALFIFFILIERKAKEPLIPATIFASSLVTGANIVTLFLYFALSSVLFFLILNLQQIHHYSPMYAGMSMLPLALLITFVSGPAGSIADKYGPRLPMIIGPLLVAVGICLLAIPGKDLSYVVSVFPAMVLMGLGMATVIAPLSKAALAVQPGFSGKASGINNAVSRFAGLLAIAVIGSVMLTLFSTALTNTISPSSLSSTQKEHILKQQDKLGGIVIPKDFDPQARVIAKTAIEDSFVSAFRIAMGINAALAMLCAIVAYLTIHNAPLKAIREQKK